MTIEPGHGNLLTADVDALVNTVNTEGVMGKGLALQFKKAFPDNFREYERASKAGEVTVGRMFVVERLASPRFIINFPTKRSWRQPSRIEYIRDGLVDLRRVIEARGITSIALPPLGCGNGGLDWGDVRPLIESELGDLPGLRVVLFEPSGPLDAADVVDRRRRPAMTPARAALIALMGRYLWTGYDYRLALVEVQKLAYFLQVAGEPLRLSFTPHYYGPYADDLRKALRNMEGHLTSGVGDGRNSPETPIELIPGALEEAAAFLRDNNEVKDRIDRVARLIEGFESPFGMELLGTVHWVAKASGGDSGNALDEVIRGVHAWSERKRSTMKDGHIRAAWNRLHELGWLQ